MQAMRETLGDRHPRTLASINNMGVYCRPWASWRRRGRCARGGAAGDEGDAGHEGVAGQGELADSRTPTTEGCQGSSLLGIRCYGCG